MLSVVVLFYVVSWGLLAGKTAHSQELNKYDHERRDTA